MGSSAQLGSTTTTTTNKSSLNNSLLLYITTITYGFITLCSNSLCAYFCFCVVDVVVVVVVVVGGGGGGGGCIHSLRTCEIHCSDSLFRLFVCLFLFCCSP